MGRGGVLVLRTQGLTCRAHHPTAAGDWPEVKHQQGVVGDRGPGPARGRAALRHGEADTNRCCSPRGAGGASLILLDPPPSALHNAAPVLSPGRHDPAPVNRLPSGSALHPPPHSHPAMSALHPPTHTATQPPSHVSPAPTHPHSHPAMSVLPPLPTPSHSPLGIALATIKNSMN